MSQINSAHAWFEQMLSNAEDKLGLDDATIAYTLFHRGIRYLRAQHRLQLNEDFLAWLEETLRDVKQKLSLTNSDIADMLLRYGTQYYFKTIIKPLIGRATGG